MIWQGTDRDAWQRHVLKHPEIAPLGFIHMLIRELAYDTDDDQLDLLIDSLVPVSSETIPVGDDIFVRRSVETGKIVGATIENYSLWSPNRYAASDLNDELLDAYRHIVRYLEVVKQKKPVAS